MWAFKRSTDTSSALPPTAMENVFAPRRRTLKGPA